ncbi:MAG: histidine--tRNA ligase [Alphaproteobacteria bacterium]|nr:histidine--tRNA ligase [Alphaproteobacteria bacterium]
MAKLQSPRGTSDLLPQDMAGHRHVINTAKTISLSFGFEEMATPIFEFTEVFARPLGETSDVVSKETYSFTDRGGEALTLRPEGTAGVVRALISAGLTQTLPQKFFYAGPMFRYERPQKGRMRQFHQIGVELLGVPGAVGDAEVITMGHMILSRLGVADKCILNINTLGDTESRLAYRQALVEYLSAFRGQLSEDSQRRLDLNPLRILDSKDEGDIALLVDAPRLDHYLNADSKAHFDAVRRYLDVAEIPAIINPRLVRGLDYYGHTTFEFITDALGAQGTVMAGGRYDGLAAMLGGGDVSGVGWAAGIERLAMLADVPPQQAVNVMMIGMSDDHMARLFPLAVSLRQQGLRVETGYAPHLGKQMKRADRIEAQQVVILGDDEAARGVAILRSMVDGAQTEVVLVDLVANLLAQHKEQ